MSPTGGDLPLEISDFLTWLSAERGRSTNTLAAYRRDLRAYWSWVRERSQDLCGVTEPEVVAYVRHLQAADRAPASVARALVAIRSLHRFLLTEGLCDQDPAADVEVPRVPQGLPKALSEDEVARLIDAVRGDGPPARRDRALLEILYGSGVRISELVGLDLADVDVDGGMMVVQGKGGKQRAVPLGRLALEALDAWLAPGGRPMLEPERWSRRGDAEALLLNQRGGRLSRQGAWSIVRGHGARVGLDDRLTPHVLRHSCATHMLDHGADIRTVQELLGHASISTTQIYTLVSTDRLREVYDAAHPRARVGRPGERTDGA